jgi:hypothetical protein
VPWRAWQASKIWLSWLSLTAIAVFFLGISWRKWPDPLVDFGREIYVPWRLSQGVVLYRDVDDFFGPLSQYFNAGLFGVFGPGMLVLVTANLCVFATIVGAIYLLFRRGWGAGAAFVSTAVFIAVFGFSQYVAAGNYNYATPYSHESTHGMLVCLLLALALSRWMENPTVLWSALIGGLFGLTAVLKTEFILAAGLLTIAAVTVRWRQKKPLPPAAIGIWAGSAALPTLAFAIYFSAHVPAREALALACHAWLGAGSVLAQAGPAQMSFLGLDRPRENVLAEAGATFAALWLTACICGFAWLTERLSALWQRLLLAGALAGGLGWLSLARIDWFNAGRCLPGLVILYVAFAAVSVWREARPLLTLRFLIALLAAALIARMILNGRLYQYGFYQAALASLLVPAVMLVELPAWLRLDRWGKAVVAIGTLALVIPGVVVLAGRSLDILQQKTETVGQGPDQFYAFPPDVEPTGEIVRIVTEWLSKLPPQQTLVVLPEGEMINYMARMPSPVAPAVFYSAAGNSGSEAKIVNDLSRRPPDWIVLVSRDLREYGIERYGEAPGKGRLILSWVANNYDQMASAGGNPVNAQQGALILRHKK